MRKPKTRIIRNVFLRELFEKIIGKIHLTDWFEKINFNGSFEKKMIHLRELLEFCTKLELVEILLQDSFEKYPTHDSFEYFS